ncbi:MULTISPECIES: hypothetical protein [Paenibacillus]|nr:MULTISPECIES: hypothetical protein [Paenibacillus]
MKQETGIVRGRFAPKSRESEVLLVKMRGLYLFTGLAGRRTHV